MTSQPVSEKSVLVLAKGFPPDLGGIETYSLEVAREYARLGYRVVVITAHSGPAAQYELDKIQVCNVGRGAQVRTALRMLRVLWRLKPGSRKFGFVHATTWRAALPAVIFWRSLPLVTTLHGREFLATRGVPLRMLMDAVYSHSRNLIVISRYSAELCLEKFPKWRVKAVIAWNGASPWAFAIGAKRSIRPDTIGGPASLTVVCAARFVQRKNIAGAIDGFSRAARRHPDMNMIIAGDGPQRQELLRRVADAGMNSKIRFLGHIQGAELQSLYENADVLLHPHSHHHDGNDVESFCLAIADGMASGVGVISGKDGAPAEYIEDGISGLLVDGRSVRAIEGALSFMYLNPAARRQMGIRAYDFARANFQWARHVAQIIGEPVKENPGK